MRICLLVLRLKIKNRVVEAVEVVEAVSWCFVLMWFSRALNCSSNCSFVV
jgi:tRNA (Thr-GGU) A37 N-methylase